MENEFSPPLFCEQQKNTIINDKVREIAGPGNDALLNVKGQILKWFFSEDGPVAKGKMKKALLLFAGPASGKSTLVQRLPEMQECCANPENFVDESAGTNSDMYVQHSIPLMLKMGMEIEVKHIACPIMEAFERDAKRPYPRTSQKFTYIHKIAQRGFMDVYEQFGNPKDKNSITFEGIVNRQTDPEKSKGVKAPASFEPLKYVSGDDAYAVIRGESLLAFGTDSSNKAYYEKFESSDLDSYEAMDYPSWLPKMDAQRLWRISRLLDSEQSSHSHDMRQLSSADGKGHKTKQDHSHRIISVQSDKEGMGKEVGSQRLTTGYTVNGIVIDLTANPKTRKAVFRFDQDERTFKAEDLTTSYLALLEKSRSENIRIKFTIRERDKYTLEVDEQQREQFFDPNAPKHMGIEEAHDHRALTGVTKPLPTSAAQETRDVGASRYDAEKAREKQVRSDVELLDDSGNVTKGMYITGLDSSNLSDDVKGKKHSRLSVSGRFFHLYSMGHDREDHEALVNGYTRELKTYESERIMDPKLLEKLPKTVRHVVDFAGFGDTEKFEAAGRAAFQIAVSKFQDQTLTAKTALEQAMPDKPQVTSRGLSRSPARTP